MSELPMMVCNEKVALVRAIPEPRHHQLLDQHAIRFCYILSIKLACVKIGMALSMAGGDPDFSGFAAETLLVAIDQTSDPGKL